MKKEIRNVSEDGKIVQITIADERWYIKTETDENGKMISFKEYPSVTWITGYTPMGIGFYKWLASKGWDEAERIKTSAGTKGSKVHYAISDLLLGNEVKMDSKYLNKETSQLEELSLEEYECLMSFAEWHAEVKPKTIQNELTVFNEDHLYAGTADYICEIEGVRWLIDFKTGADVYASYEAQLAAYANALPEELKPQKMAILQLGYKRNKVKKWKFTEIVYDFDLFLAAKKFWNKETDSVEIFQKDYPTSLSLS